MSWNNVLDIFYSANKNNNIITQPPRQNDWTVIRGIS